jgi:hypothetical protein
MDKRCLLHKTKLEPFKTFLDESGIPHRPGKGDYQVLQVYLPKIGWQVMFDKHSPEHYTVNEKLLPTVRRFLREN